MRPDAPDWIIRGASSIRSGRRQDWIIQGQMATWRLRLDHPVQSKKEQPQPRGLAQPAKWLNALGWIVRGGSSMRSPHPPERQVQGKVAARSEGDMMPKPSWSSD